MNPVTVFMTPARRFMRGFITTRNVKDVEETADKKHPERLKSAVAKSVSVARHAVVNNKKRAVSKKAEFDKKNPTWKMAKKIRVAKKLTRKKESDQYKNDPLHRNNTIPRQEVPNSIMMIGASVLGMARGSARIEANRGETYIGRQSSKRFLKKFADFRADVMNLPKNLTPKGISSLKKKKQEDARAKSILSGDI